MTDLDKADSDGGSIASTIRATLEETAAQFVQSVQTRKSPSRQGSKARDWWWRSMKLQESQDMR
jgi:hypothetical protein